MLDIFETIICVLGCGVGAIFCLSFAWMIIKLIVIALHKKNAIPYYSNQKIIDSVKNNYPDEEDNIFLTDKLTLISAKIFSNDLCKTVHKQVKNSSLLNRRIKVEATITMDDQGIFADITTSPKRSYEIITWSKYNREPLTDVDEMDQFAAAMAACIETIIKTYDARKIMHLYEFEIICEPKVDWLYGDIKVCVKFQATVPTSYIFNAL